MSRNPTLPLEGVKILDLARLGPGPHSSQILADFGADIIVLEPPSKGGRELVVGKPEEPGRRDRRRRLLGDERLQRLHLGGGEGGAAQPQAM